MTNPLDVTQTFGWQLDKGQVRKRNQDSLGAAKVKLVSEDASRSVGLYMVADGVASMADSQEASKVAVQTAMQEMMSHINDQESSDDIQHWLKSAAQMAHRSIRLQRKDEDSQGTTLVMAAVFGDEAFIVNIGDSRAYIVREGKLKQLTRDHTVAQYLADEGVIEQEETKNHPYSNVLSQAVGVDEIDADTFVETLHLGDYLLLCSDGLYGYVSDDDIVDTILKADTPQAASKELTRLANEAGGRDNIAVIIVEILDRD